jgi:hypothetical protein
MCPARRRERRRADGDARGAEGARGHLTVYADARPCSAGATILCVIEWQARDAATGAMRTHRAYVSFLMQKWGMGKQSRPVQTCVRRVLNQLNDGPLLALRDPRLEVMVRPDERRPVWAYFPIHRKRTVVRRVQPRAGTRVLLLFGAAAFEEDLGLFHHETGLTLAKTLEWGLAHTLGHVLLYLRAPRGRNDCKNAHMEWECAALGRNAQY